MSHEPDEGDRPPSPLVKQLQQKFDRMSANMLNIENNRSQSQSQMGLSKIHRVGIEHGDAPAATAAYPLLPVGRFVLCFSTI